MSFAFSFVASKKRALDHLYEMADGKTYAHVPGSVFQFVRMAVANLTDEGLISVSAVGHLSPEQPAQRRPPLRGGVVSAISVLQIEVKPVIDYLPDGDLSGDLPGKIRQ